MGKSSFAFKGNAMKRTEFNSFLLVDFAKFDFIVSLDENRFLHTFFTRQQIMSKFATGSYKWQQQM